MNAFSDKAELQEMMNQIQNENNELKESLKKFQEQIATTEKDLTKTENANEEKKKGKEN